MPPRLDGSRAKRDRAETHLKSLETCLGEFMAANPYTITVEPYPEEGRYLLKLRNPKPFPAQDVALLIGDCVHNLRAALDYIVWELAGAELTDRTSMFPIFDDKDKFRTHGAWRIKGVPDEPRALIKRMQPYHAGHGARDLALWAIEHLDAADKHKLLTVTLPITDSLNVIFTADPPVVLHASLSIPQPLAALKDDTVIAVATLLPPTPHAQVKTEFAPEIAFGYDGISGPFPRFVVPNLKVLLGEVDRVIAAFEKFF
jgi:hypothetical protein